MASSTLSAASLDITNAVGGIDELEREVRDSVAHASLLRNNLPAEFDSLHDGGSGGGLVAKICFSDGICWADKMFASSQQVQNAIYGNAVMNIVRKYCPSIPIPEPRAWFKARIHHHMTE